MISWKQKAKSRITKSKNCKPLQRLPTITMEPNQFSPTLNEVEEIKAKNALLPQLERTCYKCGHKPCESCYNWCDYFMSDITWQGNWEDLDESDVDENGKVSPPHCCCDGECSYL